MLGMAGNLRHGHEIPQARATRTMTRAAARTHAHVQGGLAAPGAEGACVRGRGREQMEARVETRRAGGGAGRDEGARTHACELGIGGRIRWQHTGAQGGT